MHYVVYPFFSSFFNHFFAFSPHSNLHWYNIRHLLGDPEMVALGQMFMDSFFCTLTTEEEEEGEGTSGGLSRENFIARLVEEATAEERMVEGYGSDGDGEGGEGDGDGLMEQVAESQQQVSAQCN